MSSGRRHRRRLRAALVISGAALLAIPGGAGAQEDVRPLGLNELETSGHPNVSAVVGAPTELTGVGLDASNFVVTENGEPVDVNVAQLPNDGLEVVLAIDTSGSMEGGAINSARQAALEFFEAMPDTTPISVVSFDSAPVVRAPFTTDPAMLALSVTFLQASGETSLNDAIVTSAAEFDPASNARKVIILLTDGGDTASSATIDDAVASLEGTDITVYAVALLTGEADFAALDRLATVSSGRVVPAVDAVALNGVYEQIAAELVNQYDLVWTSSTGGQTDVRIELTAPTSGTKYAAERTLTYPAVAPPPPTTILQAPVPTTVVDELPAPNIVKVAETSGATWTKVGGLLALAVAMFIVSYLILQPRYRVRKLHRQVSNPFGRPNLSEAGTRAVSWAERLLARYDRTRRIRLLLDRAGLTISPAEIVALMLGVSAVGFLIGLAVGGLIIGLVWAALVIVGFRVVVGLMAARRIAAFGGQLESTLQIMEGSLRAGFGISQAINTIAAEADAPTTEEFHRVLTEVRLGKDLIHSLHDVAIRMKNDDFAWVADAIEINREVGGNLAEVLEKVGETIRSRQRLSRQVKALSAEGKLSAYILLGLPVVMFAWLSLSNPTYLDQLTGDPRGVGLLIAAGAFMLVGTLWMRKIIDLKY